MKGNRFIKKTCLLFGEGKSEKHFFSFLENSDKFKSQFSINWSVQTDSASGSSAKTIMEKCLHRVYDIDFKLVLCFIDIDDLIVDFPNSYEQKQKEYEDFFSKQAPEGNLYVIIWQINNHEDELSRAANKIVKKKRIAQCLKIHEMKIINSDFVKKIFSYFHKV